jgi:hypothetical protein
MIFGVVVLGRGRSYEMKIAQLLIVLGLIAGTTVMMGVSKSPRSTLASCHPAPDGPNAPATVTQSQETTSLDLKGMNVKRQVVNGNNGGLFTKTWVFYTLEDHRVVVVICIDKEKKGFPVSGEVFMFAKDATLKDIAKWVNNQHSDGLYPDIPEPKTTIKLPAESCQSLECKLLGKETSPPFPCDQYSVEIKLSEVKVNEQYRLQEHKDTVNVPVEAK